MRASTDRAATAQKKKTGRTAEEGGGCKGGLRRRLEEGTNKAGMAAASQPQGLKGPVSKADDGKCQEGGTTGRPKQKGRNVANGGGMAQTSSSGGAGRPDCRQGVPSRWKKRAPSTASLSTGTKVRGTQV